MYKDMMKEVAINNGLGVDVGQSVDSVSVPPRTVGQELQEPEMLKKSGPVIDPNALQTAKIVTIEPLEMVKAVTVEPVLQMSKIVTIEPQGMSRQAISIESPVLQMAQAVPIEILEMEKAVKVTVKPVLQMSKIVTIEPSSTPTLAEQLQVKKANLTKTDIGAKVYGYDKPTKTGPDQAKPLTEAEKFAEELRIKKANLTKTDMGAEVYGYDKPGGLSQVEVSTGIIPDFPKVVMGPIIEVSSVTVAEPKVKLEMHQAVEAVSLIREPITLVEPKPKLEMGPIIEVSSVTVAEPKVKLEMHQAVETVAVIVNPISGNIITPQVAQKVQEIRQVLDTSLPQAPKKDNGKEALEMLNGKSSKEALEAISTAIGKGDGKLVKAMMDIIDKPPEGTKIPSVGKMALNKIYTDQMESTKGMKLDQDRSKVQRAAGAIADKAGIVDHEKRAMKPKASGPER